MIREYTWECESCDHIFSVFCEMKDYDKKPKCPKCNKKRKVYRNFAADKVASNYIKGLHEVATLGEYADKKCKNMSEDHKHEVLAQQKTKKQGPKKELPDGMSWAKDDGYLAKGKGRKK